MVATEVVRGPCKVASKECVGEACSKNSEHPKWTWRRASKAGHLKPGDPRFGEVETTWEVGDDVCGPCKGLATAPAAAKQTAAAPKAPAAGQHGAADRSTTAAPVKAPAAPCNSGRGQGRTAEASAAADAAGRGAVGRGAAGRGATSTKAPAASKGGGRKAATQAQAAAAQEKAKQVKAAAAVAAAKEAAAAAMAAVAAAVAAANEQAPGWQDVGAAVAAADVGAAAALSLWHTGGELQLLDLHEIVGHRQRDPCKPDGVPQYLVRGEYNYALEVKEERGTYHEEQFEATLWINEEDFLNYYVIDEGIQLDKGLANGGTDEEDAELVYGGELETYLEAFVAGVRAGERRRDARTRAMRAENAQEQAARTAARAASEATAGASSGLAALAAAASGTA